MSESNGRGDPAAVAPAPPSKSQTKREMTALQHLGERLAALSPARLERLPLAEPLRQALLDSQRITSREAHRRQLQYIGRLMRAEPDPAGIASALEAMEAPGRQEKALSHRVERWRDRLLLEGEGALEDLLRDWPRADRQRLRQLVKSARARDLDSGAVSARRLFRYLRELMGSAGEPDPPGSESL
jgi:ribosome-associated protein